VHSFISDMRVFWGMSISRFCGWKWAGIPAAKTKETLFVGWH
jgi:hypothetical protein